MTRRKTQFAGARWPRILIYGVTGLAWLGYAAGSSAQMATARFAIEASQVFEAMRVAELPVEGVQVKLATPVSSSAASVKVAIESAAMFGPHEMRLRVACSNRNECLPFLATAVFPETVDVSKLHLLHASSPSGEHQASAQESGGNGSTGSTALRSANVLRAGAPVTLQFDADRIHVRIEVICLQPGAPGSRIRVSSLDHKQIYVAEVMTPTLVKGDLLK